MKVFWYANLIDINYTWYYYAIIYTIDSVCVPFVLIVIVVIQPDVCDMMICVLYLLLYHQEEPLFCIGVV